jgi:protease I
MRAVILVERGFQDEEYVYCYYRMKEAGWEVSVATPEGKDVFGKFGVPARATTSIENVCSDVWTLYDAIVLPGGFENPDRLRMRLDVQACVKNHFNAGKLVAAICHAPSILISSGVGQGRKMTGYWSIKEDLKNFGADYRDEAVVVDGNLITSPHYKFNGDFMRAVVEWRPSAPRWPEAAHAANF